MLESKLTLVFAQVQPRLFYQSGPQVNKCAGLDESTPNGFFCIAMACQTHAGLPRCQPLLCDWFFAAKVAPEWERLTAHIEADPESKEKLGWVREMYAFSVAMALKQVMRNALFLSATINSPLGTGYQDCFTLQHSPTV